MMLILCWCILLYVQAKTIANWTQMPQREVTDSISYRRIGVVIENNWILIKKDINLRGSVCVLPKGMTLCAKGGMLKNGTLIGNDTKIQGGSVLFDKVKIEGTWNIPEISTRMFADLSYENSLRDVVSLANPRIKNRIVIQEGNYIVAAHKNGDVCIPVGSNTDLMINGTIRLVPNSYKSYSMILLKGNNIHVFGKGSVIGDKHTHTGTAGEWGMGIRMTGAVDSSVKGLTVKDCWGDCIYIGGDSKKILIENCTLDNGRRQGVSITKADHVTIRKCKITNVSGTNPQYAIDIEPNKGDVVTKIVIERVEVKDCEGGILATKPSVKKDTLNSSRIGDVVIKNCKIAVFSKYPLNLKDCDYSTVEGCTIVSTNGLPAVYLRNVNKAVVRNNTIRFKKTIAGSVKEYMRKVFGKNELKPITIIRSKTQVVTNNKLIEL